MQSFASSAVPWGRPVVRDIPLPPFTTVEDYRRYLSLLAQYVALLEEVPSLSTRVLCEVLEQPWPHSLPEGGELTRLELQVSLATFFPAPWTPAALAKALIVLEHRDEPRAYSGGAWNWGYDPDFTATPLSDGGWRVERHERGTRRTETLAADGDLMLMWMDDFRGRFPFPFGHRLAEEDGRMLGPAVAAVRASPIAAQAPFRSMEPWREACNEARRAGEHR